MAMAEQDSYQRISLGGYQIDSIAGSALWTAEQSDYTLCILHQCTYMINASVKSHGTTNV